MAVLEASLKRGGTVAFVNGLWLAYSRPPCKGHYHLSHKGHLHLLHKGTVLMHKILQFMNGVRLYQTNGLFIKCLKFYIQFMNGVRLYQTNGLFIKCPYIYMYSGTSLLQSSWAKHLEVDVLRKCNGGIE